jgi:hypothetical protein
VQVGDTRTCQKNEEGCDQIQRLQGVVLEGLRNSNDNKHASRQGDKELQLCDVASTVGMNHEWFALLCFHRISK